MIPRCSVCKVEIPLNASWHQSRNRTRNWCSLECMVKDPAVEVETRDAPLVVVVPG